MDAITRAPSRVRLQNALCLARVVFVEPVSPRMRRITFHAPEFAHFCSAAADDHVKCFFPPPGGTQPVMPEVSRRGPSEQQLIARDYTPRRFDVKACEVTIEFVLHAHGPASNWARRAKPGDLLGIGGPRGSTIIPDDHEAYLLIGDETALPSIARRLEEMPPGVCAIALIEAADHQEERHLPSAANAKLIWLHRNAKRPGMSGLLEDALRLLRLPSRDVYAWIGCEIEVARRLRTYLMEEEGLPRSQIKAAGYWKIGQAGAADKIE